MRKLLVALPLTGLFLIGCAAPPPAGLEGGRLAPCPGSPNCVSSYEGMDCLPLRGTPAETMERLVAAATSLSRATVAERTDNYLRVEYRSRIFRFVDDAEFFVDEDAGCVQFRSAARSGYYDFGVNRKRMESIRERYTGK